MTMNRNAKTLGVSAIVIVLVGLGVSLSYLPNLNTNNNSTQTTTTTTNTEPSRPDLQSSLVYNSVNITYLRYAGFKIQYQDVIIYIDPLWIWNLDIQFEPGSYIINTHAHLTHCSPRDIQEVSDNDTITIASPDVADLNNIADNKRHYTPDYVARPGDTLSFEGVTFEFVPMYNIVESRLWAHPPETEDFGVIVEIGGVRIFDASDSDRILELKEIDADIALLPVSGYAEMSAEEAAEAVEDLKINSDLKFAIPMHWKSYTGNIFDAYDFYELADCPVVILAPIVMDNLPPASSIPN
ncbi:MAG: MBL fold metallo-hydrolase [Candidatus Thorarchaeota archaeon]